MLRLPPHGQCPTGRRGTRARVERPVMDSLDGLERFYALIAADGDDGGLAPRLLVAVTVHV